LPGNGDVCLVVCGLHTYRLSLKRFSDAEGQGTLADRKDMGQSAEVVFASGAVYHVIGVVAQLTLDRDKTQEG
jgi:hypothetical protein